jgi:nucleoside-diphosphate-sugar epimerase
MHTVLITGAAGYVGAMLCRRFAARGDVVRVVGIDKESVPEFLTNIPKLEWITANLSDGSWQKQAQDYMPTVVVHTAWQIREMYGKQKMQWKWNVEGSDAVFDFAFTTPGVTKLIHFSTASSYGAYTSNTLSHYFKEDEGFRDEEYLYAVEKKVAEEHLLKKYEAAVQSGSEVKVRIVRPAAITGPRGRFMRVRFGLQAALSGQLKGSFIHRIVSLLVSWVPATPLWCRQFIHEDDVVNIVEALAFTDHTDTYQVFNITPPGSPVLAPEMADAVGKRVLHIQPWMARIAFFFFWHVTRGRIPTSKGGWRFYCYPIVMDGTLLTKVYGYTYKYLSGDAFRFTDGEYESYVPESSRRHKK